MRLIIRLAIVLLIAAFLFAHRSEVRSVLRRVDASFKDFKSCVRALGELMRELPAGVAALKDLRREMESLKTAAEPAAKTES
jgi:Sec-independent protein translocase protein TatA